MIPTAYINAWSDYAPWPTEEQIEQDLILSRLIVEIANDELLGEEIAFRGGTCLHKLHLPQALRYSEDLDYTRTNDSARLGECFDALRQIAGDIGLTEIRRTFPNRKSNNGTIWFETTAESGQSSIRIKIETNVEETSFLHDCHFIDFAVNSAWWSGQGHVRTFVTEEILATKIRALYQRLKGRDLFDIWVALTHLNLDNYKVVEALTHYMGVEIYSYPQLRQHLDRKLSDNHFLADIYDLTTDLRGYSPKQAANLVLKRIGLLLRNAPADSHQISEPAFP